MIYSKPSFIYARVKLGQGLWWANINKPPVWFIGALKPKEVEYDLLGRPVAEILAVRYYPHKEATDKYLAVDKYDIYLTTKLAVSLNNKTKQYAFKRAAIGVGAAIDLQFPSAQISGTIIDISNKPLADTYVEKIILLTSTYNYPWEFAAIKIGDRYFDGQDTVFEVLDKKATNISILSPDPYGNLTTATTELRNYLAVRAKIKLKEKNGQLLFGEEQVVKSGGPLSVTTDYFVFDGFSVASIE